MSTSVANHSTRPTTSNLNTVTLTVQLYSSCSISRKIINSIISYSYILNFNSPFNYRYIATVAIL